MCTGSITDSDWFTQFGMSIPKTITAPGTYTASSSGDRERGIVVAANFRAPMVPFDFVDGFRVDPIMVQLTSVGHNAGDRIAGRFNVIARHPVTGQTYTVSADFYTTLREP